MKCYHNTLVLKKITMYMIQNHVPSGSFIIWWYSLQCSFEITKEIGFYLPILFFFHPSFTFSLSRTHPLNSGSQFSVSDGTCVCFQCAPTLTLSLLAAAVSVSPSTNSATGWRIAGMGQMNPSVALDGANPTSINAGEWWYIPQVTVANGKQPDSSSKLINSSWCLLNYNIWLV